MITTLRCAAPCHLACLPPTLRPNLQVEVSGVVMFKSIVEQQLSLSLYIYIYIMILHNTTQQHMHKTLAD